MDLMEEVLRQQCRAIGELMQEHQQSPSGLYREYLVAYEIARAKLVGYARAKKIQTEAKDEGSEQKGDGAALER